MTNTEKRLARAPGDTDYLFESAIVGARVTLGPVDRASVPEVVVPVVRTDQERCACRLFMRQLRRKRHCASAPRPRATPLQMVAIPWAERPFKSCSRSAVSTPPSRRNIQSADARRRSRSIGGDKPTTCLDRDRRRRLIVPECRPMRLHRAIMTASQFLARTAANLAATGWSREQAGRVCRPPRAAASTLPRRF
jgi:hypothetical protein